MNNYRLQRLRKQGNCRALWVSMHLSGENNGGTDRSRTGVHGFAIRCIATLPPRQPIGTIARAAPALQVRKFRLRRAKPPIIMFSFRLSWQT